jgi:hypothetical protein
LVPALALLDASARLLARPLALAKCALARCALAKSAPYAGAQADGPGDQPSGSPLRKKTGLPFEKFFTGAALDAAAGGTAAVPPFVTNVTPPSFAWGGSSFSEQGTRFAIILIVDQPRTR